MMQYKGLHGVRERLIVSDAQVDRQIDQLWDLTIQKILRNLKIPFIMNP